MDKNDFSWARASKVEKIKAVMEQMKETQIEENGDRWENEGGLMEVPLSDTPAPPSQDQIIHPRRPLPPVPADDANFDNQLEENVKAAIRKRNNVIKIREVDWTDDDWYHGC